MNGSKRSAKGWRTRKDRKAIEGYRRQLENRRREYGQVAKADSLSGRRNRALAVGECVLRLMDELRELNRTTRLLDGTLFWTIVEQRLKDSDGKKGFSYTVCWRVKSDEPYYTNDEIEAEIAKTEKLMAEEREEMFREEDGDA